LISTHDILIITPNPPYENQLYSKAKFLKEKITENNFERVLSSVVKEGDIVVDLSYDVGVIDMTKCCQKLKCCYVETADGYWPSYYTNKDNIESYSLKHLLKEQVLNDTTVFINGGWSPGLSAFFVKKALTQLAVHLNVAYEDMSTSQLAERLQVRVVHIQSDDCTVIDQPNKQRRNGEFVSNWCPNILYRECVCPTEIPIGTHEKQWSPHGKHPNISKLSDLGLDCKYSSPINKSDRMIGGINVTHEDTFSIADMLTIKDENDLVKYRPTVSFILKMASYSNDSFQENRTFPINTRSVSSSELTGSKRAGVALLCRNGMLSNFGYTITPDSNSPSPTVLGLYAALTWVIHNKNAGFNEFENIPLSTLQTILKPYLPDFYCSIERSNLFQSDDDLTFDKFLI